MTFQLDLRLIVEDLTNRNCLFDASIRSIHGGFKYCSKPIESGQVELREELYRREDRISLDLAEAESLHAMRLQRSLREL